MSEHSVQIGRQSVVPSGSDCLNCALFPISKIQLASCLYFQKKTSGSTVTSGFTSRPFSHIQPLLVNPIKNHVWHNLRDIWECGFGFWPGYAHTSYLSHASYEVWVCGCGGGWWGYKRSLRSTSTWPNPWTQQCHRTNQTFWKLRG